MIFKIGYDSSSCKLKKLNGLINKFLNAIFSLGHSIQTNIEHNMDIVSSTDIINTIQVCNISGISGLFYTNNNYVIQMCNISDVNCTIINYDN